VNILSEPGLGGQLSRNSSSAPAIGSRLPEKLGRKDGIELDSDGCVVGSEELLGDCVGEILEDSDGHVVGSKDTLGDRDGFIERERLGNSDGFIERERLGDSDGISVPLGDCDNTLEGDDDGEILSDSDGCIVGSDEILGDDEIIERKRLRDSDGLCVPLGNCGDVL